MEQDRVYITGHKHPDTDSVAAAIGYAFYKRANGIKAVPCRLGKLSAETRYLLDRFGFEQPMLLEDARYKLGEIELDRTVSISPDKTLCEAINVLKKSNLQICSVLDNEGRLLGLVTNSDAAALYMGDRASTAKILRETPVECIGKAVSGKVVYNDPEARSNGRVRIVALTKEKLSDFEARRKRDGAGKSDVRRYMAQQDQQQEKNTAMAEALARWMEKNKEK